MRAPLNPTGSCVHADMATFALAGSGGRGTVLPLHLLTSSRRAGTCHVCGPAPRLPGFTELGILSACKHAFGAAALRVPARRIMQAPLHLPCLLTVSGGAGTCMHKCMHAGLMS